MTCTARTGCGGVRGLIEIQMRRVVALRSGSVATSVTAPFGRERHETVKRPLSTRTGRPSAASVAPGSSDPSTRIGAPDGITAPGGSRVIFGPFVSTVKRQLLVVREPGKLPVTLAWRR